MTIDELFNVTIFRIALFFCDNQGLMGCRIFAMRKAVETCNSDARGHRFYMHVLRIVEARMEARGLLVRVQVTA